MPGTAHSNLRFQTRFSHSKISDRRINLAVFPYSVFNLWVFLHPNLWRVSLGASSISGYSFISQPAATLTSSPPDGALSMWEFQSKSPVMKNLNAGFIMKQDQYRSSWEPDKLVPSDQHFFPLSSTHKETPAGSCHSALWQWFLTLALLTLGGGC